MRTPRALIALAVASVAIGVSGATAQAPAPRDPTQPCPGTTKPGCGDNYLQSVRIALERLNSTTLAYPDTVDTSTATTQPDLFKPGGNRVGPPEQTSFNGVGYGKTVWYDLNPPVDGNVFAQAVGKGFDPLLCIVRYDARDVPNFRPLGPYECSNQDDSPSDGLLKNGVKRSRAYSIQVGGVGQGGGSLKFDVNFTPYRLRATSKAAFQLTPTGVKLVSLRVSVNRKSRVEVGCKGCGKRVKRGRKVKFNFGGKPLRAGSKLSIRVTRGGEIGVYQVRRIRRGRAPTETPERCLNPGSKKPRKTCP